MAIARFLLVVARDYWGSSISEATARAYGARLQAVLPGGGLALAAPPQYLLGPTVSPATVHSALYDFAAASLRSLPSRAGDARDVVLHVYMCGHGTQTPDVDGDEAALGAEGADGMDEAYMLPEGLVTDDDITAALDEGVRAASRERPDQKRPLVVLVSDHCCSGSMLDRRPGLSYDWVSFGASGDDRDSYATDEGHVMTLALLGVLEGGGGGEGGEGGAGLSAAEVRDRLEATMRGSFLGELQRPTVHASEAGLEHRLRPFA